MEMIADWWKSPLAEDHNNYLHSLELKIPRYSHRFTHDNNRIFLVDWLAKICDGLRRTDGNLCATARHLAVSILDHYMDGVLATDDWPLSELKLMALAALLIAAKFEEREERIPRQAELNSYVTVPASGFTADQYLKMELEILRYFNWNIGHPTAAHFVDYYSMHAIQPTDLCSDRPQINTETNKLFVDKYTQYFLEISLQDRFYRRFKPSQVCAACIASARLCLGIQITWTIELHKQTGYEYTDLHQIVQRLIGVYHMRDMRRTQQNSKSQPTQQLYIVTTDNFIL